MELTVKARVQDMPTARKCADAAAKMSAFKSRVLLRKGNITVNAKSLLGLLSLGIEDGVSVTIIASGEDEAQAVCTMADLLQEK